MDPTQPINGYFKEENFLQALPQDALGEIASYLAKEHLGNLASVCTFYNTPEASNVLWKTLAQEQLPAVYLNLPGLILKEKFKSYHNFLKSKVDLVLKNANRKVAYNREIKSIFPKQLLILLNDKDISLRDKYVAINTKLHIVRMAHALCILNCSPEYFNNVGPSAIKDWSEALDLTLELVDINTPLDAQPAIFLCIAHKKEEITKKIIDAGFDFFSHTQQFLDALQEGAFEKEFLDKMAAYAAEKLAHKN